MSDATPSPEIEEIDWTFGLTKPDFRFAAWLFNRWADDEGQPPHPPVTPGDAP